MTASQDLAASSPGIARSSQSGHLAGSIASVFTMEDQQKVQKWNSGGDGGADWGSVPRNSSRYAKAKPAWLGLSSSSREGGNRSCIVDFHIRA
jgi:hypothetical protein